MRLCQSHARSHARATHAQEMAAALVQLTTPEMQDLNLPQLWSTFKTLGLFRTCLSDPILSPTFCFPSLCICVSATSCGSRHLVTCFNEGFIACTVAPAPNPFLSRLLLVCVYMFFNCAGEFQYMKKSYKDAHRNFFIALMYVILRKRAHICVHVR